MRSTDPCGRLALLLIIAVALGTAACTGTSTQADAGPSLSAAATTATAPEVSTSHLPLRGPAHPDRATIIDGSWLIGVDFPPALYMTPTAVTRCHWRVVDYASGALIEEGDYAGPGPAAIWVGDGDLFQSEGCLLWQGYPQLTGQRVTANAPTVGSEGSIGDGRWRVGRDIPPGRYRSDRAGVGACIFQVDRSDNRADESFSSSATVRSIPAYLDLLLNAGDVFTTRDCGEWAQLSG